ncbi:MAG: DUF58 domain-containing protein [Blastomonas sp.]
MIYPTTRCAVLIALGAPVALVLSAWRPDLWAIGPAWSAMIMLLCLIDGLVAARLSNWEVDAPRSIALGDPLAVGITATFGGTIMPRCGEASLATDSEIVPGGRSMAALERDRGEGGLAGRFVLEPARRGKIVFDRVWLRWQGPLGLSWRQARRAVDGAIAVLPNISAIRSPAFQVFLKDALFGLLARKMRGEGSEFEALSDFQAGMDRRSIDWKQSARHSRLLAKEFDTERNNQIVFALDCGSDMCEPVAGIPRIDRAVSAALLTAYVALKAGDRARLFAFAARPEASTPFVSGTRSFHRLQAEAADIDYRHQETNYTLALSTLAAQLQRRSMIVVFTDFSDPTSAELMLESVGRLIDRHLLLFVVMDDEDLLSILDQPPETSDKVAESVAAADLLAQRRLVITRLRHLGIEVVEGSHENIGTRLMNAYLSIKRRGQL